MCPPGIRAPSASGSGIRRDVRSPWKIGRANSKKKPYLLRWVVAERVVVKTFPAFGHIAESWLEFSTGYVAARWSSLAAKTRDSITDSLPTAAIGQRHDLRGLKHRDPHAIRVCRAARFMRDYAPSAHVAAAGLGSQTITSCQHA